MKKEIKDNLEYSLSTFAIEKLRPSDKAIELSRKNAEGTISLDHVIEEIKRKYRVAGV